MLQTYDLATLAELQLCKNLIKTKRIASAPAFPKYINEKVQASVQPSDAAHANVQARLFNSNPVKTAMSEIIDRIRKVLGIEDIQRVQKKRTRAVDHVSDPSAGDTPLRGEDEGPGSQDESDHETSDWHGFSAVESVQGDHHDNSSEIGSMDFEMYNSRLGPSSDVETEVEGSIEGLLQQEEVAKHNALEQEPLNSRHNTTYSLSKDLSLFPESDNSSSTPSPPPLVRKAPGKASKPRSTTFLPSLAVGGYWSGSDSTASDLDTGDNKIRKNRRGQQERRAIWEKKYGHNANHLRRENKVQNRDEGWDLRRGARSSEDARGKRGRGRGRGGMQRESRPVEAGSVGATGANSHPVLAKKLKAVEAPLHPSWQAAKKRKDEKRSVAFTGTKLVFD